MSECRRSGVIHHGAELGMAIQIVEGSHGRATNGTRYAAARAADSDTDKLRDGLRLQQSGSDALISLVRHRKVGERPRSELSAQLAVVLLYGYPLRSQPCRSYALRLAARLALQTGSSAEETPAEGWRRSRPPKVATATGARIPAMLVPLVPER